MWKTTRAIKSHADGGSALGAGQSVTPSAFTTERWQRLINDGVIVEVKTAVSAPIDATDSAVKLANKKGIDLLSIIGSGKNGRITLSDVREAIL